MLASLAEDGMESKILSTIGLLLGLGGAIPIGVELAGEERIGNWMARLAPQLEGLIRSRVVTASVLIIVALLVALNIALAVGMDLRFRDSEEFLPSRPWARSFLSIVVAVIALPVLSKGSLRFVALLGTMADRLKSPDTSISTLVWIGAFAIMVAFGCQMAAVWLA